MKILHYLAGPCNGGVASLVYDLCVNYIRQGHKVDILSSRIDDKYFTNIQRYTQLGINVYRHASSKNILKNILDLKSRMTEYDVVHVHLFPHQFISAIAYSLIPKDKRPILVTTEHNTWNNRRKYPILKTLDRWFYKKYDKIISISPQTEVNLNEWLESPELKKRILTISNGIDIEKFRTATNHLPELINTHTDCKYVVMVARMVAPKDPVTIVKALSLCDENIHAIFIGNGDLEKAIMETAESLHISHRIHNLGFQSNVPQLVKGCHLGILSTHWDGFGLVAAEYMASGIPVIASNVDGLRDVIGKPEYLFETGDYNTLAKKINYLLKNQAAYEEAIRYFENNVAKFSASKMAENYLSLYQNLLNSNTSC